MTTDVSRNTMALAAVCLSALMLGLEISSIPSTLPTLQSVLPASFKELQWIMNAYTIAMCTVLMAMGALADRFGRKCIFLIGIFVFGAASFACGLANTPSLLIGARFLQGASGAAMLACQVAVLSDQFRSGKERARAFGWWGIIFGVGLGFGPIIGSLIASFAGWQWVFLVHTVLAVGTAFLTLAGVVESRDPHATRIDFAGMATLSLSVFCLVYFITQGQAIGLTSLHGLAILAASGISLLAFIVIENSIARPMFDFRVFKVRLFSGALLGSSGMNFSFWPFVIYLPIFLQAVLGYNSIEAGFILLAYTVPSLVVPPLAEHLLLQRGPRFVIPLGLFTIGTGFLLMRFATFGDQAGIAIVPGCIVAGVGLGLTNTPVTNTATGALPVERAGMASGMDMSARMISLAINIALMGFILVLGISGALAPNFPASAALIDAIAAGNFSEAGAAGVSHEQAISALNDGFGWVMLYGATAAWIMGALSLTVLPRRCDKVGLAAAPGG
ncbi:MFS transporter [Phyllobacterium sp. SYP-B3895]|uniref:MFS transporter n=1 Tax=Phyllobacterium sp. SYP-B3895 TaxID=2663240 RepID=UPI001FED6110|nr:MFS transporter [Phyllobacterium sp. SYP-B3895]